MTLAEAYRSWNREQNALARYRRDLKRIALDLESIELDLESIELDMAHAIRLQNLEYEAGIAKTLSEVPRYRRTVDAFLDYRGYSKNHDGWKAACGTDIGLWRKTRRMEWPMLWDAILVSRKMRKD